MAVRIDDMEDDALYEVDSYEPCNTDIFFDNKIQYKSRSIVNDSRSDFKYMDGMLIPSCYSIDSVLGCIDLLIDDKDVLEYIDEDEELSEGLLERESIEIVCKKFV